MTPGERRANKRMRTNRRKRQTLLVAGLKAKPCMDCGNCFPSVCMDFDHRNATTKRDSVSSMVEGGREALMAEIAKCDLVCSNCHRIRTSRRRASALGDVVDAPLAIDVDHGWVI